MIDVKGLERVFVSGKHVTKALKGVDLKLPNTGLVFIIGKSGSGKSTLLNLIAGLDKPTAGQILFNGKDVCKFNEKQLDEYHYSNIGFIFQNYCLIDEMSVEANIAMGLKEKPKHIKLQIQQALDDVALSGIAKKRVKHLSGGQKQRIAIARALIKDPPVLLCDEPTGNLDRQSSEDVLKILKKRSRTSLVLVVSHNLPEAYRFADRIITLSKGFIVEDLSFRPESHVDTETLYLSNPDEMTPEQIEGVNKALAEGRIKRIQPRKELFQPSSPCPDEHGEEKKLKGHFFMPIPTMMKTINHSKWRMALFPILTGILLSLFSCLFSLYRFDASEYASTAYRQSEKTDFIMQRGALTKNGKTTVNRLLPIQDEEWQVLNDDYEGKYYPIYKFPISLPFADTDRLAIDGTVNAAYMSSVWVNQSQGLMIVDNDFLMSHLKVDQIEYVALAEKTCPTGIYVTDYFADAILVQKSSYKSYNDFVGKYAQIGRLRNGTVYVNGIIKTDYKNKISGLLDEFGKGEENSAILQSQYESELEYLSYALNFVYTLNKDFMEDLKSDTNTMPLLFLPHGSFSSSATGWKATTTSYQTGYSSLLKKGEVLLTENAAAQIFKVGDHNELANLIHKGNDEGGFSFSLGTVSQKNSTEIDYAPFLQGCKIRLYSDYDDETLARYSITSAAISIRMSKEDYLEFRYRELFPYAIAFDSPDQFDYVSSLLSPYHYAAKSALYDVMSQVASGISIFSQAFRILSLISILGSAVLLVLFSISLIQSQKYNIGVWKALGYRGRDLSCYFTLETLFFTLLSSLWFGAGYVLISNMLNRVLTQALFRSSHSSSIIRIISFTWHNYFMGIGIALGVVLILVFGFLLMLRKEKAIDVIQNKE